jgi:hypothetical protein
VSATRHFSRLRLEFSEEIILIGKLLPTGRKTPLYRGRLYALVDDQMLIDLHPFLLVRPCQVCGTLEVYHPASFSDDEVQLKSIDRGHSQVTSDVALLRAVHTAFV